MAKLTNRLTSSSMVALYLRASEKVESSVPADVKTSGEMELKNGVIVKHSIVLKDTCLNGRQYECSFSTSSRESGQRKRFTSILKSLRTVLEWRQMTGSKTNTFCHQLGHVHIIRPRGPILINFVTVSRRIRIWFQRQSTFSNRVHVSAVQIYTAARMSARKHQTWKERSYNLILNTYSKSKIICVRATGNYELCAPKK